MTEETRRALAEHIADRINRGLADHEIAHELRDIQIAVKLGYIPRLGDLIGVIRDLMTDRPLPDEGDA